MARLMYIAAAAILAAIGSASDIEVNLESPLEALACLLVASFERLLIHQRTVPEFSVLERLKKALRTVLNHFRRQNTHA